MTEIKLGTSGYSFDDWKGVFYPDSSRKKNWFLHYIKYFDTSEINATYYHIPSRRVFESLNDRSPEKFEFIVKVHQETTHIRKNSTEAMKSLIDVVDPVYKAGKLSGFLAQFPYSFKNTADNRRYIADVKEDCRDIPLYIEFRHTSWNHPAVFDYLQRNGILYCCVDGPQLKGLLPPQTITTGETGYVRFHGRNSDTWWDSSKGDRYDYLYKEDELKDWIKRIRKMNSKVNKLFIYFNNCHAGHAVRGARMMSELLKTSFNINPLVQDLLEL